MKIDRQALVTRHNIRFMGSTPTQILQVGNGEFAFGVDPTGLQTFYGNTMSQWGWHTAPLPEGIGVDDFKPELWDAQGRKVPYSTSTEGQEKIYSWLRENPHRLNLGRISLKIAKKDESALDLEDIANAIRQLDLWRGIITSSYEIEGQPVRVVTCADPLADAVSVRIESPLITLGRLSLVFSFPYGNAGATDGANWNSPEKHTTTIAKIANGGALLDRILDSDRYGVAIGWSTNAELKQVGEHCSLLVPAEGADFIEFTCEFRAGGVGDNLPAPFDKVRTASEVHWRRFWESGGAVDLSESKDERWKELERRVVLSQYLMAVNEAGSLPPQESGLVNNSGWYGKFHLEMHWWHGTHYAVWGRLPLFERSLGWYQRILPAAQSLAKSQGYGGARWPKMVGPEGRDSPSGIGPLLIWQQPHPIFYAELDYRLHPSRKTLDKWEEIVNQSAEFMASYAWINTETGKFDLGPPMILASETTSADVTRNPAFELAYWRYGLRVAQLWRERLGMERNPGWDNLLSNLAPLPAQDGLYVLYEGIPGMWGSKNRSHPDVLGASAFLPGEDADPEIMRRTLDKVMENWQWDTTWGWDYPWIAMTAARYGRPDVAIQALFHDHGKNSYDAAGVCCGGPAGVYFPGNGGLLYAVAMMAAGWDGCPERDAPGFPDDGTWSVRWEGLETAP